MYMLKIIFNISNISLREYNDLNNSERFQIVYN